MIIQQVDSISSGNMRKRINVTLERKTIEGKGEKMADKLYKHFFACSNCGAEDYAIVSKEPEIGGITESGCIKCGGIRRLRYVRTERAKE